MLCWYFTLSSESQRCQDKQSDMFNLLCSLYSSKNALPEKSFCWTLLAQIYAAAHTIDFPQPSLSCLFPLLLGSFLSVSRIPVSLHRQLAVWLRASHLTLVVSLSWGVSEAGWRCPSAFGNKAAEKLAIENNLHGGVPHNWGRKASGEQADLVLTLLPHDSGKKHVSFKIETEFFFFSKGTPASILLFLFILNWFQNFK